MKQKNPVFEISFHYYYTNIGMGLSDFFSCQLPEVIRNSPSQNSGNSSQEIQDISGLTPPPPGMD